MFKVAQTRFNTQGWVRVVKGEKKENRRGKKRAGRCLSAATYFEFWRESFGELQGGATEFF